MQIEMSWETLWHLAITLGLGLLVGLERERAGKEVGLRTFSFAALLGYLSWKMGPLYTLAVLAFVAVIVVVINVNALKKGTSVEATTAVSLFLTCFVGMLVAQEALFVAVAVAIFMLLLLSWKEEMLVFTMRLQRSEIHAAITLGLLSFVILPVLPVGPFDPWGLFSPREMWWMVVLISAIGFANYILLRLYGTRGINYTGFLGGLVNSTATAAELAATVKESKGNLEDTAFRGLMLAKTAAFLRNGLILAIFAPSALPAGFVPVGLMIAVTVALALFRQARDGEAPPEINVQSPFSLRSAFSFGLMFAAITVIGRIAQQFAGNLGFYAVAFAGGIISSSSTAATAAHLVSQGMISPLVAGTGVVLSSISSALIILPIVWRSSGSARLARKVAWAVAAVVFVSAVGIAVNPLVLQQYHAIEAWMNGN
ncbi:MAG: DUF4010 domain-containing protein [Clostridia bacterium]